MNSPPRKVLLRANYSDDYRKAVWRRFCTLFDQSKSTRRHFYEDLFSLVDTNTRHIQADFDPKFRYEFPISVINDDARTIISEFYNEGGDRKFRNPLFWLFDAYVQIATPGFADIDADRRGVDDIGRDIGQFLRDPHLGAQNYNLSTASQKLTKYFEYDNVDTLNQFDGGMRYLCLFPGRTVHYLFAVDFKYDIPKTKIDMARYVRHKHSDLQLYYGFCAPGQGFSPVIMKSHTVGERIAGFIYASAELINVSSEALDGLRFEVFTTDRQFHGDAGRFDYSATGIFSRALAEAKGVKLARELRPVNRGTEKYSNLEQMVSSIKIDILGRERV